MVSCIEIFKLTCDNHIPVNPATKKKKINDIEAYKAASTFRAPFNKLNVQLTTFIVAGSEIIIVSVLYSALLRWSNPIKYIWCPQTKNPI
jgi:hypothetical protein